MANNIDLNLNLNPPSAPPNVTPPSDNQTPPNVTPPSNNQTPRRKRTKPSNNDTTSSSSSPRPKPPKKPDPNAPLISEPCKVCGKQFWSSKALHGHMRSHPERQWRGINPPPNHQQAIMPAPPVEEGQILVNASTTGSSVGRVACGGCNKVFDSRQTLEGHVCTALLNLNEHPPPPAQEIVGMSHRCDICSKVFSSGQALGGHMRFHWFKDRKEKKEASTSGIDLNVPASTNLPGSSSDALPESSLDLKLGL